MKRLLTIMAVMAVFCITTFTTLASASNVVYYGDADKFVFEPGSDHSPTDLFTNFKNIMPGEKVTQLIELRNDSSNKSDVMLYIRPLEVDDNSKDFLSKLTLTVNYPNVSDTDKKLDDWTYLGTVKSGDKINLEVILEVSTDMDSTYSNRTAYVNWEFLAIEDETENPGITKPEQKPENKPEVKPDEQPSDKQEGPTYTNPGQLGDVSNMVTWIVCLLLSIITLLLLRVGKTKIKDGKSRNE